MKSCENKANYVSAQTEIILFTFADIVTASGNTGEAPLPDDSGGWIET